MIDLDDTGTIMIASNNFVRFDDGEQLEAGDEVWLPAAAGGGIGVVESITMILVEGIPSIAIRCEDKNGKGHVMVFNT